MWKKKSFMVSILALIIVAVFLFYIRVYFPVKYVDDIVEISNKYKVEPEIIISIIKVESNFKEKVVSKKGAIGIMQILPSTAEWILERDNEKYSFESLYEYRRNIEIGTKYYSYLYNEFKDQENALAAYNAGPSRVKDGSWKKITETKNYVKKVKFYREMYKYIIKKHEKNSKQKNIDKYDKM